MIERRRRMRLTEEPRFSDIVEVVLRQEELQCDGSAEVCVLRSIDHAHAAGAERLAHLEVRDGSAGESEGVGRRMAVGEECGVERRELRAGLRICRQERLDRSP